MVVFAGRDSAANYFNDIHLLDLGTSKVTLHPFSEPLNNIIIIIIFSFFSGDRPR